MKAKFLLWALTIVILCGAQTKKQSETRYVVDVSESTVQWTGYYVFSFGSHYGSVNLSAGDLYVSGDEITNGSFEIDMTSILDLDMEDEGAQSLVDHLKSDDFFSVDQFPSARFEIRKVEAIEEATPDGPNFEITGDLTIKDVHHPVTFPATISIEGQMLKASARFKFDRTKWDIRYNSGRFFDDIGDGAISDGIGLELEITAHKTTQP
jgi:polyisoprenoid-binding protein YceI